MKGVFCCNRPDLIDQVYTPESRSAIRRSCVLPDRVVTYSQLAECADLTRSAEGLFSTWGMPDLSREEIRLYFPNVKVLFYAAGSVQGFARPFLTSGIRVVSGWQANAVPVAEYAASQILLANKGFFRSSRMTRSDYQEARRISERYPGNYDTLVGLLGAGMIGTLVIRRLRASQLRIKVFDPFLTEDRAAELGVERWSLAEIFSRCQTISNHLANNEQTRHLLTAEFFNALLPDATFINTGRGAQLVEADLIAALKAEPGRMALLDVTDPEPPGADSELRTLPNVILTPHIAGGMNQEVGRMSAYMVEELDRLLAGERLQYEVTLPMLATMA